MCIVHRSKRSDFKSIGSPRRTCPNQFITLLNTYHSMGICVFVKNRFFSRFLSTNCHQILSPSLQQLSSYLCLSTKCIMPAQVPKTQELGRFGASFRRLRSGKAFSFSGGGFAPLTLTRGSAPGPRWGLCPQTPVIGSCSALAMAWPPPMKISAYAPG